MTDERASTGCRVFFVCSYGGSGSWLLTRFLASYGRAFHVHSRRPPPKLTRIETTTLTGEYEWFSRDREISPSRLADYSVVFIYSKPIFSIMSRMGWSRFHFSNIEVPSLDALQGVTRQEYLQGNRDLIDYEGFFDNYVTRKLNQNYDIVCVNYHKLWENLERFFSALDLPSADIEEFPRFRKPTKWREIAAMSSCKMYEGFNRRIEDTEPLVVVRGSANSDAPLSHDITGD